jgi:hypothetical protein
MRSMSKKSWLCLALIVVAVLISARVTYAGALDVLHYSATLEPDLADSHLHLRFWDTALYTATLCEVSSYERLRFMPQIHADKRRSAFNLRKSAAN